MPSVSAVAITRPDQQNTKEEIAEVAARWLQNQPELFPLYARFVESSKTYQRSFVLPVQELLTLQGPAHRAELFEEHAPQLGERVMREVLQRSEVKPEEVQSFVFTSCTCPSIPSVDGTLIQNVGLSPHVRRVPIYQHGCAGGIIGLSLGSCFAERGGQVLLTSVELCSLIFQLNDTRPSQLVGAAIFADGAASAIISPQERGLCFVGMQSYLLPDTRHLMGYDIFDDGSHLRLDRELPSRLAQVVPNLVGEFLAGHKLEQENVAWWLFHPGGMKILDFLENSFSLRLAQCRWAKDVLSHYGNLSSSSVLFVLHEFLQDGEYRDGDYVLMLGIGPGLTVELILFQYRS